MINEDALKWALHKVETFHAVNKDQSFRDKLDAMTTMREFFGLTDDICELFNEWSQRFAGEGHESAMMLGLLIGSIASEYEVW